MALTKQELPIKLSPGTTLEIASTGWRARGHLFSDHRYYCSETCQRNTRLNGARRTHEKGFMRAWAHPHFTTLTLWILSDAPRSSPGLRVDLNTNFPLFSLQSKGQTFLNGSLISDSHSQVSFSCEYFGIPILPDCLSQIHALEIYSFHWSTTYGNQITVKIGNLLHMC